MVEKCKFFGCAKLQTILVEIKLGAERDGTGLAHSVIQNLKTINKILSSGRDIDGSVFRARSPRNSSAEKARHLYSISIFNIDIELRSRHPAVRTTFPQY